MNETLTLILNLLNPVALGLGIVLTVQVFRLKNPVCIVLALLLAGYQTRNLITAISVSYYSTYLIRPTGLLAWSALGRSIEIASTSVAILWFASKVQVQWLMKWFLTPDEIDQTPRTQSSGDLPPSYWVVTFTRVVRDNIKDELLKPLDE